MPGAAYTTTPLPTAARRDKREAILDAALALFCEHTFDGTPVPLIAERAGVGAGTIYRYFDSKEALANAVYRRAKGEMKRMLVDEAPRGVAAREEFAHWWRALWRFASEQPQAFAFLETHHHAPYLDAEGRAAGAGLLDGARALVKRGQREGAVRRIDADTLISMVFGAFTGLVKGASDAHLKPTARTIAETEACVWAMLAV